MSPYPRTMSLIEIERLAYITGDTRTADVLVRAEEEAEYNDEELEAEQ